MWNPPSAPEIADVESAVCPGDRLVLLVSPERHGRPWQHRAGLHVSHDSPDPKNQLEFDANRIPRLRL